jgi:sulfofructose kinase
LTIVLCVGHAVQDFVFGVAEFPTRAQKHRAESFESVGGGPAATAAVAIARLGGRAHLAARVGEDEVGRLIAAELEGYGVDCSALRRCPGCASSVSAVLVDRRGERLIVNRLDPGLPIESGWLPGPRGLGAAAVLAETRWPEGALTALESARRAGVPGVLDADVPVPADGRLLAVASHVAFSADALREYTGRQDLEEALREVSARIGAWCCVTAGASGVYVAEAGRTWHLPAFAVAVVDTLGAGDVWHGAFALALAERQVALQAVRFASAAAALKVGRPGGRRGAPLRTEVEAMLAVAGAGG